MKADNGRRGIVHRLGRLFTHNFWLKLVALLLALIIYHTMKPSSRHAWDSRSFRVPMVQDAPQDAQRGK